MDITSEERPKHDGINFNSVWLGCEHSGRMYVSSGFDVLCRHCECHGAWKEDKERQLNYTLFDDLYSITPSDCFSPHRIYALLSAGL